ncbi:MAG: type II secretion system protein GspD [Candidatus Gastranaerophilales bacterium]|nr:type II secretion system protein GspD [Candidatus Gastranaerophilales bacterium]
MNKYRNKLISITLAAIVSGFLGINSTSAEYSKIPLRNEIKDNSAGIQLKGGVKIDHKKQVVSLNLRDSNLRQVLRMLANKADMNVIIHDGIRDETISLDLMNVELNKAFEYIMTIKELTYWKDGNTLIIAKREDAKNLSLNVAQVRAIKIKYTEAQKIANFLNKNIFTVSNPNISKASIVTTNPSTNEILLFGNDNDIKLAEEVVKYLDAKPNVKSFTVNFADPVALASKICWTVFKSSDGESDFSREAELEEGSNITMVCGNTAEPGATTESDAFADYNAPSFWILADTGLNQITIYGGTTEQLYMSEEIIKNFDKREPQVLIEVSIIELNESGSNALINELSFGTGSNTIDFTANGVTTFPALNFNGKRRMEGLGRPSLSSTIATLITENKGRVLANPRIISANNVKSHIDISSDFPVGKEITYNTETNDRTTKSKIENAGISFDIIPKVSPNGYVTLSIEPTYKSVKEVIEDSTGSGDNETKSITTLFNNRELTVKNVRVKDGNTLILAGLIQENETISHGKVPVLSSIPVIGTIFQSQSTSKDRSELVIMITPRILQDPDEVSEKL